MMLPHIHGAGNETRTRDLNHGKIGVGLLDYLVVLIVHVENEETIGIISMRKADGNETDIYYQNVGYF
jgi:uncharacterized DUF497 family protein